MLERAAEEMLPEIFIDIIDLKIVDFCQKLIFVGFSHCAQWNICHTVLKIFDCNDILEIKGY